MLKVDDPVGAISVHGANGLWGVISVGLFADGKSNYGGSWNGVSGSVTGLFYGDAGQLVAQLMGVATLIGFVFTMSFVFNLVIDVVMGQRVSAQTELEGLDMPEMGARGVSGLRAEGRRHGRGVPDMAQSDLVNDIAAGCAACNRRPSRRFPGGIRTRFRRQELAVYIRTLELACLEQPQSADLRTCLGMAHAVNYDVYKSMDALEAATRVDPTHFWAQLKYAELQYRLRALRRRRDGKRPRPSNSPKPLAAVARPQATAGDSQVESREHPEYHVGQAVDASGAGT